MGFIYVLIKFYYLLTGSSYGFPAKQFPAPVLLGVVVCSARRRLINHGDVPDGGSAYGIRRAAETSNRPSVHCAFRARLCVTNYSESKFHCIHVCAPLGSMKSTRIMRLSELIRSRKSSCTVQPMEGFRSFFVLFTLCLSSPQSQQRRRLPEQTSHK